MKAYRLFIVLFMLPCILAACSSPNPETAVAQLHNGITFQEVCDLIGSNYVKVDDTSAEYAYLRTYTWTTEGNDQVTITFLCDNSEDFFSRFLKREFRLPEEASCPDTELTPNEQRLFHEWLSRAQATHAHIQYKDGSSQTLFSTKEA